MRILNSGKLITNQTAELIWDTRTGNIRDFTSICVIRDTIRKWNKCRHVDRNFSFELLINNLPQGWLNCGWEAVCISRVGFKVAFCHSEMCQSHPARASHRHTDCILSNFMSQCLNTISIQNLKTAIKEWSVLHCEVAVRTDNWYWVNGAAGQGEGGGRWCVRSVSSTQPRPAQQPGPLQSPHWTLDCLTKSSQTSISEF